MNAEVNGVLNMSFFELKMGIGGKSAAIFVDKTQVEGKQ